ncbi:MAG: DHH family phosphoesterase [Clostridium sp.]|nr:DHH family phosphoesterase [Clostridium sp.]
MLYTKKADFARIAQKFGIDPVTARIITNRGISGEEEIEKYLHGTLADLHDPALLPGAGKAADLILQRIRSGSRIRVVGDYDIDGVCAAYILVTALRRLGADCDYDIPDRIKDGYGINEAIIRRAHEDGIDTIVTCDNGISAKSQVELAKAFGMTVVVTDHHEVPTEREESGQDAAAEDNKSEESGRDAAAENRRPEESRQVVPPADVVIDPKLSESRYPFVEICGAVVAWKLVKLIFAAAGRPEEEWLDWLEFAAIATVGDVMPLTDENRIIVRHGLRKIGKTENAGLRMLVEKTGLDPRQITAYHVGFVIGPCINAGGRLETARLALELFLSEDPEETERMAQALRDLNDRRKDMTEKAVQEATELVNTRYSADSVLVVYLPDCHESLAGIIAGRLREHYQKPAIVLTDGAEAVKGSGRSIESYHMFLKLTEVSDLLLKYGGHPMAAGLSLKRENVDLFREKLNENAGLSEEDFKAKIWIDVPMPLGYITEKLVEELRILEPYGQGNEKPQFALKSLYIRACRVMGKNRNVVRMTLQEQDGFAMDALWFGNGDEFERERAGRRFVDIIYYPDINEYGGNRSLQAVVRRYRFH